ncbi:prefoldin beta-like protein [Kipferlia bialata]|uniref:Prefoldin beta-like protein n=1 Tax=Kipferlia bialata TaxID=797122 RepID=A0A9K3CT32_9EUKA|nr:prefoldin beta-like protein [Kipferlia bialata]|eukprot:g2611.t1
MNQAELQSQWTKSQKAYESKTDAFRRLTAQEMENAMVEEELNLLDDDCKIYKSVGPALVPTSLDSAKDTVAQRLTYIRREKERCEKDIATAEASLRDMQIGIAKQQQQAQQQKKR